MLGNPYQRYRQVTVETASVAELMVLLYRRAVQVLGEAEGAIRGRDVPRAHARLVYAQEIVAELMASVNLEAGELAHQLWAIYDYAQRRLVEANVRKDAAIVAEVRELLAGLLEAWEQVAAQERASQAAPLAANA
ncbi:MAG: flagellar export chaperone FliS [Thermomicrobium sp.]|nr:flagellar export chaperone FliS [Thermomicrobium sp.]MDW8060833.1 flagellar export chaperone FliS [Thermomicrobium sp.]